MRFIPSQGTMIWKSFLFSTHVGRKPWIRIKYLGWSILYRYVLSHRIVFHGGLVMKGNESHNDHFLFWAFGNFKLRQSASDVTVSFYWTFREHLNIVQCILHYQDCSGLLWSPSAASDALLRLQCPPISLCVSAYTCTANTRWVHTGKQNNTFAVNSWHSPMSR